MNMEDISPRDAIRILKEGNQRFYSERTENTNDIRLQVQKTADGQFPFAAILGCVDSRSPSELLFDQGLGKIINIRIAGNVVNRDVLGSLEYACVVLNTKLILVLGHTQCGAIQAACDDVKLGNVTSLLEKIKPAIEAEKLTLDNRNGSNPDFVNSVGKENICLSIEHIRKGSKVIRELEKTGKIMIAAAIYEIETGKVSFIED